MTTWKEAYDPSWKRGDDYSCRAGELTSLKGAPSSVAGDFVCSDNRLTSLEGAPSSVGGIFSCEYNNLTSLEGAPSSIGMSLKSGFNCGHNKLTSLKDIHLQIKHVGTSIYLDKNPIKSHVLGLLLIDGLKFVTLSNRNVENILNRYLPSKGMESVLLAQEELILAGLDAYAQL